LPPPSNTSRAKTTPTSTTAASTSVLVVGDDEESSTARRPVSERAKYQLLKGQPISYAPLSTSKATADLTSAVNKPLECTVFIYKGIIRYGMDEFDIIWSDKGLSTSIYHPNKKIDNVESFMDTLGATSHTYENIIRNWKKDCLSASATSLPISGSLPGGFQPILPIQLVARVFGILQGSIWS